MSGAASGLSPGKTREKLEAGQRGISSSQRSLPLHRADQILAANAVSGQGESGGNVSADSAIQERHGAPKSGPGPHDRSGPETRRRIGQELRVERAGNLSSKKIGLGLANPNRPSGEFRFAVELFDLHRRNVDQVGAETPARRKPRDDAFGERSRGDGGIRAGESREEAGPGARAEPAVHFRGVKMVRRQIERPLLVRIFSGDGAMPDRAERLRCRYRNGPLQRRKFNVGLGQAHRLIYVRRTQESGQENPSPQSTAPEVTPRDELRAS